MLTVSIITNTDRIPFTLDCVTSRLVSTSKAVLSRETNFEDGMLCYSSYCQLWNNNYKKFNIYFRFTFTDEKGKGIDVSFGSDENEVFAAGQSATQTTREYMFETDARRYHLIDTPGIGDCRGIGKDKENFENILEFLTLYNKINAVVVLLKPNNPRLTVAFRFCVVELLTHLHKSLVSNIIFAFTNSRGTFYKPGDSLPVLKELLQEYNLKIDVSPSNYFCFDNEAFRYLLL